ncbi:MAG: hypothetical protein Q8P02_00365, partial [Candidatus Micrarchaeota archaeon]|nr:hypothetical protein [Candidatus Micrarchaeota archaeon]
CDSDTRIKVSTRLASSLKVAASFSGTACADIKVPGSGTSDTQSFTVKPSGSGTTITLSPVQYGDCVLVFNSETDSHQALGVQEMWLSSKCEDLPGSPSNPICDPQDASCPAPSASPTPSASPSASPGAADCSTRGGQCITYGQSCPSGMVPSTASATGGIGGSIGGGIGGALPSSASCQNLGGSCVFSQTGTCPAGQTRLDTSTGLGVCGIAESGSLLCCGSSGATGSTPTASLTCSQSGQTCCVPANQVCQAPVFNFQNILAKYLGYYAGVQGLSSYPQQVTAASAPTRIATTPQGISVIKTGEGCSASGEGLSCTKPIFPLIPINALAFSVENQLFSSTNVLVSKSAGTCFTVEEVGKNSGFFGILGGIKNEVSSAAGLMNKQVRTYVVTFRPSPACIQYQLGADGQVAMALTEVAEKGVSVKVQSTGVLGGRDFFVKFTVEPDNAAPASQLGVVVLPTGEIVGRGKTGYKFQEPAVIVNNLHAEKGVEFKVGGPALSSEVVVKPTTVQVGRFTLGPTSGKADLKATFTGSAPSSLPLSFKKVDAPAGLDGYDIVGNAGASAQGLLSCSGASFCTTEQVNAVLKAAKAELNELGSAYASSIDTLAYENAVSGTNQIYQQALRDATREYMALRGQYQACIAQGQDPLSGNRAYCNQNNGNAPIYPYGQQLYGAYGQQGFNNPYGAGQAQGGVYGYGAGYNPYQSNLYPSQGLYPSYVNDPQIQQGFSGAFGTGWQQAGCQS